MGMKNLLLDPWCALLNALCALLNALYTFGTKCYLSSSEMAVVCKNLAIVFLTGGAILVGYHVYIYCSIEPQFSHRGASEQFPAVIDDSLHVMSVSIMEVLCEPHAIQPGFDQDAEKMTTWCAGKCPMRIPSDMVHAFAMCSDQVNKEDNKAFPCNSPKCKAVKQALDNNKFAVPKCDADTLSFVQRRTKVTNQMIRDGFVDHFNPNISETNWNESIELEARYSTLLLKTLPKDALRLARHLKICAYSYKTYHQTIEDRSTPFSEAAAYWLMRIFIMVVVWYLPHNTWTYAMTALVLLYMCFTTYNFEEFKFTYRVLITTLSVALLLYKLFKNVEIARD
jgi:hypothetical protein